MVMQPMTEKQMTRVVQITVREVFAELIPRIHATMTAAYDDGVRPSLRAWEGGSSCEPAKLS